MCSKQLALSHWKPGIEDRVCVRGGWVPFGTSVTQNNESPRLFPWVPEVNELFSRCLIVGFTSGIGVAQNLCSRRLLKAPTKRFFMLIEMNLLDCLYSFRRHLFAGSRWLGLVHTRLSVITSPPASQSKLASRLVCYSSSSLACNDALIPNFFFYKSFFGTLSFEFY